MGEFYTSILDSAGTNIDSSITNWDIASYPNNIKTSQKKYKFPGVVTDNKGNKVYIKEVIYSDPATIVFWNDGTKTICKAAENDTYNPEAGLAICILKKALGSTAVYNLFSSWCCFDCSEQTVRVDLSQVIKELKK